MPGCPESRVAGVSCEVFVAVQAATNASYTVTLIYGDYYIWLPVGVPTVRVLRVCAGVCWSDTLACGR